MESNKWGHLRVVIDFGQVGIDPKPRKAHLSSRHSGINPLPAVFLRLSQINLANRVWTQTFLGLSSCSTHNDRKDINTLRDCKIPSVEKDMEIEGENSTKQELTQMTPSMVLKSSTCPRRCTAKGFVQG